MKGALFAVLFAAAQASASTFVGNGGNHGDVEIAVATRQIQEASNSVAERDASDGPLCECANAFENHAMCDYLKDLSKEQRTYCSDALKRLAPRLEALVSGDGKVTFTWTHERVSVREGDTVRAADAVADRGQRVVTINQERFISMMSYERLFLLAHELFHFLDHEGQPLTDQGERGPFAGREGSRTFINAMSAGLVMAASDAAILRRYTSTLRRPQGWRKTWIDAAFGSSRNSREQQGAYNIKEFSRTGISLRHYFGAFGAIALWKRDTGKKDILTEIRAGETIETFGFGLTYRAFPFRDPLSFLGQSHLEARITAEYLTGQYKVSDSAGPIEATTSAWGAAFGLAYHVPLFYGFWANVSGSIDMTPRSYSRPKVVYDSNVTATQIGVSYGF